MSPDGQGESICCKTVRETLENLKVGPHRILTPLSQQGFSEGRDCGRGGFPAFPLLPVKGDLDRLLRLEAKLQAKIRAANAAVGTETPVLANTEAESQAYADHLKTYVKRLSDGDATLLDEQSDKGGHSSAFAGELFRSRLRRAAEEGEINRLKELPWGIGAAFVQQSPTLAEPAVFFACRTRHGERYWRMVSQSGEILHRDDLPMLELINPQEQPGIPISSNLDLEKLFALAADDICKTHNALPEPKRNAPLPASQRWALDILRSPDVPAGKEFNGTYVRKCPRVQKPLQH